MITQSSHSDHTVFSPLNNIHNNNSPKIMRKRRGYVDEHGEGGSVAERLAELPAASLLVHRFVPASAPQTCQCSIDLPVPHRPASAPQTCQCPTDLPVLHRPASAPQTCQCPTDLHRLFNSLYAMFRVVPRSAANAIGPCTVPLCAVGEPTETLPKGTLGFPWECAYSLSMLLCSTATHGRESYPNQLLTAGSLTPTSYPRQGVLPQPATHGRESYPNQLPMAGNLTPASYPRQGVLPQPATHDRMSYPNQLLTAGSPTPTSYPNLQRMSESHGDLEQNPDFRPHIAKCPFVWNQN
ncbi:hypothetical protein P4O66_003466 [Electrophorus voltai]|uniref:Uncharacterized protein n=1 Tax=Electrophorus voltai TaxID=2609070 RepID=A0AAD8YP60_9TELE|nr:hypothetical protein P4O66_003466 [Electrophorus voltai]